ncbi:MAG: hypothetical protein ACO2PM_15185, partial [Pyrobaculum sp.]
MAQRLFGGVFPVFGWAGGPLGGWPSGSFEARLKRFKPLLAPPLVAMVLATDMAEEMGLIIACP